MTHRVKARFKGQRHRGTKGFGYYIPALDRLTHSPEEDKILSHLLAQNASEILFHHRQPTSTANVQNACHPFSTRRSGDLFDHEYILVHNGYLSNHHDLKEAHAELGIQYVSTQPDGRFNDSEALLYDIALYLDGQQTELHAKGAIAFVVIQRPKNGDSSPTKLFWGRNLSSPLQLHYRKNRFLTLASEGKGRSVTPNMLHSFDYTTSQFDSAELEIPAYEYKTTYYAGGADDSYNDHSIWNSTRDFTDAEWVRWMAGESILEILSSRKRSHHLLIPPATTPPATIETNFEYAYYNHEGDHYWANTSPLIPDKFCHKKGDLCPKATASPADDEPAREALVTELVSSYIDLVLQRANWDPTEARDVVEFELIHRENEYKALKTKIAQIEDEQGRVAEFLSVSDRMDVLDEEIKVRRRALFHLDAQVDYEDDLIREEALAQAELTNTREGDQTL